MAGSRIMDRGVALARASHAGPTVAMTLAITGLLAGAGWRAGPLALGAAAALAGQLSVGWANDAHDAPLDRSAGRDAKPVVAGRLGERGLMRAAVAMLAAAVALSCLAAWPAGIWHIVAVASAWAYNLRLSRTRWSWLPYAVSFACLAPFATLGAPVPVWPDAWFVVALAAVGIAAHAANALPDLALDAAAGVGGMATELGERRTRGVAVAGLAVAAAAIATAVPAGLAVTLAAALALAAGVALVGRAKTAFAAVIAAGFAAIAVIVVSGAPLG